VHFHGSPSQMSWNWIVQRISWISRFVRVPFMNFTFFLV
jgi:hypothetical protein